MSPTDRQWEAMTGYKINRTAQRRRQAAERAAVLKICGLPPEDLPGSAERYVATTGELIRSLREERNLSADDIDRLIAEEI